MVSTPASGRDIKRTRRPAEPAAVVDNQADRRSPGTPVAAAEGSTRPDWAVDLHARTIVNDIFDLIASFEITAPAGG